jgi:hypothetical protein
MDFNLNEEGTSLKTDPEKVYSNAESIYKGNNTTHKEQYAEAAVMDGTVTITLPATPPESVLVDGCAWSAEGAGTRMAHFSFKDVGIGKSYACAVHLSLYWAEKAIQGESPLRAGWSWVDAENNLYDSLQAAMDAGNKLYTGTPITYTVKQSSNIEATVLDFIFSDDVADLTADDISVLSDIGYATGKKLSGSGKTWIFTFDGVTDGAVSITINKWGIAGNTVMLTVHGPALLKAGIAEAGIAAMGGVVIAPRWMLEIPDSKIIKDIDLGEYTSRWMAEIPGKKSIKDIAVPGTHDTATWKMVTGETRCQSRSISEQLNDGIRAFDIRVGYNGQLYHGDFACSVTLNDIIDAFINHLKGHKSETILAMLSWEGVNEPTYHLSDYQRWCASAFSGPRANYWYLSSVIPTLDTVRGKIMLINGDDTGKAGVSLGSFRRQNDWDPGNWTMTAKTRVELKIDLIKKFLDRESRDSAQNSFMLMNCWNKQFNFGYSVEWYADRINNGMKSYGPYPRGVQMMDFYQMGNVSRIIDSGCNK